MIDNFSAFNNFSKEIFTQFFYALFNSLIFCWANTFFKNKTQIPAFFAYFYNHFYTRFCNVEERERESLAYSLS